MINSRTKGISFERGIAIRLRKWFPNARRGLQYQAGEYCPDIIGTPFYIECKRGKKHLWEGSVALNPAKQADRVWLYDGVEDIAEEWDEPFEHILIIWKLDNQPIKVTLAYNDLLQLQNKSRQSELGDSLITVIWKEFAEVLNSRYEVKG